MIILPIVAFFLLYFIVQEQENNWRKSLLITGLIWGLIVTIITEGLSFIYSLHWLGLTLSWLMVDLGCILYLLLNDKKQEFEKVSFKRDFKKLLSYCSFNHSIYLGLIWIVGMLGVSAILTAPNNEDSQIYHLSRVEHWINNQGVHHYATETLKQLDQNPWSEYAVTHFEILLGSNYLANTVQWFSMIICLIGVSLIAESLGTKSKGQILSIFFCATIPMGMLQAVSTQNDYILSVWMVCLSYFTVLILQDGLCLKNNLWFGLSLGLAILTKGTAYIYVLPFCLALLVWGINNLGKKVWQPVVISLGVMLGINGGHYYRNFMLFSSPLGASTGDFFNKSITPLTFISNLLKNLALHSDIVRYLGLDKFHVSPITGIVHKLIMIVHNILGLNIVDPRITSGSKQFFVPGISFHEDTEGNPFHLLLVAIAIVIFIQMIRGKNKEDLLRNNLSFYYVLMVLGGFFLFCVLLTWSPWRSRLHLPLFVLISPWVGFVFSWTFSRRLNYGLMILLFMLCQRWLFINQTHPFLGEHSIFKTPRVAEYFIYRKIGYNDPRPYIHASRWLGSRKCINIGLKKQGNTYEYPLWVLLKNQNVRSTLQDVLVSNVSAQLMEEKKEIKKTPLCAIIAIGESQELKNDQSIKLDENTYSKVWSEKEVSIFLNHASQLTYSP